jgi:diaminopimelate epimerase
MVRSLQKWNGAGNDFLVDVASPAELASWTKEHAIAVCDRAHGLGADGLLLASLDGDAVTMTLYNADGSIAEMSGNGIRCLVAAVRRATKATWSELLVSTVAGPRTVTLEMSSDVDGHGTGLMGTVAFLEAPEGSLGAADVGNPHVVVRDNDSWTDADREHVAHAMQAAMPESANVEFVTVRHPARVAIKVYERGVGWTQACGTGSVATAAVLYSLGLTGPKAVVENPGGELIVSLEGSQATLGGPVTFEGDMEWTL